MLTILKIFCYFFCSFLTVLSSYAQGFSDYRLSTDSAEVSSYIPDAFDQIDIRENIQIPVGFGLRTSLDSFTLSSISLGQGAFFYRAENSSEQLSVFPHAFGIDDSKFSTSKVEYSISDSVIAIRYTDVGLFDFYENYLFGQVFSERLSFTIGVSRTSDFFISYDQIDFGGNPMYDEGSGLITINPDTFISPTPLDTFYWQFGLLAGSGNASGSLFVNEVTPNNFIADTRNRRDRTLKFERDTSVCFLLSRSDVSSTTEIEPSTQHHTACDIHSLAEANARLNVSPAFTKLVHLTTDGHWQEIQKPITKDEAYEGWYIFSHLAKGKKCTHSFYAIE